MTDWGPAPGLTAAAVGRARFLAPLLAWFGSLLGLALATGLGVARVVVHQCVTAEGPLAFVGLRLSLLRGVADCPDGTLALVPGVPQGAVLVLSMAVPVVAAHLSFGALGLGLAAVAARATDSVRRLLAAAPARPPHAPRLVVTGRIHLGAPSPDHTVARRWRPAEVHPRRGPPVVFA